jgi:hypothetical protein
MKQLGGARSPPNLFAGRSSRVRQNAGNPHSGECGYLGSSLEAALGIAPRIFFTSQAAEIRNHDACSVKKNILTRPQLLKGTKS